MKNIRRGMGFGRGMGYYNIAPMDSHIHSLSAKGVRSYLFLTSGSNVIESKGYNVKNAKKKAEVEHKKFIKKLPQHKNDKIIAYDTFGREGISYHNWKSLNAKGKYNIVTEQSVTGQKLYVIRPKNALFKWATEHNLSDDYDPFSDKSEAKKILKVWNKQLNAKGKSIDDRLGQIAVTGAMLTGIKLADDVIKGEPIEKIKENKKILEDGFSALASLTEISHATSTKKRFSDWATKYGYKIRFFDVDRQDWNKKVPMDYEGELYYPYDEYRQTGYGAYHIGSTIEKLKNEGRELLIVDSSRNRRFLFATNPKVTK